MSAREGSWSGAGIVLSRGSVVESLRWIWKKELIYSCDFPCFSIFALEDRTWRSHLLRTVCRLRSNFLENQRRSGGLPPEEGEGLRSNGKFQLIPLSS